MENSILRGRLEEMRDFELRTAMQAASSVNAGSIYPVLFNFVSKPGLLNSSKVIIRHLI